MKERTGAFRVLCGEYVTAESGTGVVHQAPYFGEVRTRNFITMSKLFILQCVSTNQYSCCRTLINLLIN